jgi:hypothetical protein
MAFERGLYIFAVGFSVSLIDRSMRINKTKLLVDEDYWIGQRFANQSADERYA